MQVRQNYKSKHMDDQNTSCQQTFQTGGIKIKKKSSKENSTLMEGQDRHRNWHYMCMIKVYPSYFIAGKYKH